MLHVYAALLSPYASFLVVRMYDRTKIHKFLKQFPINIYQLTVEVFTPGSGEEDTASKMMLCIVNKASSIIKVLKLRARLVDETVN
jgi:hypothetical protein